LKINWLRGVIRLHFNNVGVLGFIFIVSHSYQTSFNFSRSDLNLDCKLHDYMITRFTLTTKFIYSSSSTWFSNTIINFYLNFNNLFQLLCLQFENNNTNNTLLMKIQLELMYPMWIKFYHIYYFLVFDYIKYRHPILIFFFVNLL